jgi:hypothetical protein
MSIAFAVATKAAVLSKMHQRSQLIAELCRFCEEAVEHIDYVTEPASVRRHLRHLDGESKVVRDGFSPSGVGRRAVRFVERRVDLDGGKASRIPLNFTAASSFGLTACLPPPGNARLWLTVCDQRPAERQVEGLNYSSAVPLFIRESRRPLLGPLRWWEPTVPLK